MYFFSKKIIFSVFTRIFGALSGIALTYTITSHASASDAGTFFFIFALISLFGTLLTLGWQTLLVRIVSSALVEKKTSDAIRFVYDSTSHVISIALVFCALCILSLFFVSLDISILVTIICISSLPFFCLNLIICSAFQGSSNTNECAFFQSLFTNLLTILLLLSYFYLQNEIHSSAMVSIFAFSVVFNCLVACLVWKIKNKVNLKFSFKLKLPKKYVGPILPLGIILGLTSILQWSGQVIGGVFLSSSDLAQLAVCTRVAMLISFPLIVVNLVTAPVYASTYKLGDLIGLKTLSIKAGRIMVTIALPLFLFLFLKAELILTFFGSDYAQAKNVLRLLALGQFFNVLAGSVGYLLNMTGHEKDYQNITFVTFTITIITILMFTPIFGLIGAAAGSAVALSLQNILGILFVKKRLGFNALNVFK